MRHQNSVFHLLSKHIPFRSFARLVDKHGTDRRVRRLSTKSQLMALLYGQLAGASSLREIETALESHRARLYHLGSRRVSRSTLADANAKRSAMVFCELFAEMVGQARRGLRRKLGEAVRLIDATGLKLSTLSADWARYATGVCGAKLHVVYDPDAGCPVYFAVTAAKVNDITAAKRMPIEAGATYVFDLAYYDYGWWAKLDAAGCRIVTRLKRNTKLTLIAERSVEEGSSVLSDRIGHLPQRLASSRNNPMQNKVREVRVKTATGKELSILTNDLQSPAAVIAELYKQRWEIELFFRWIKQTLKIKHLLGTSENAVRTQVAVALITFLILRLAQAAQKQIESPLAFARLVRANLMHKRPIDRLIEPPPPMIRDPRQLSLGLTSC
jgi:transposase